MKKYRGQLHYISPDLGINCPTLPLLKYKYPPATKRIVGNIAKALLVNPRLYTQVLHIMNKMCLPPPFEDYNIPESMASGTNASCLHDELSSNESETEAEDFKKTFYERTVTLPRKRKRLATGILDDERKNLLNEKCVSVQKPSNNDEPIFEEAPKFPPPKAISINPVCQLPLTEETCSKHGGFGKIAKLLEEKSTETQEKEVTEFITDEELRNGRIKDDEFSLHSVFKNYHRGDKSVRLYVKNLSKKVEENDLKRIYGRYIVWNSTTQRNMFSVCLLKKGKMKGQAFVTFPSEDIASKALRDTNGFRLLDKIMVVQEFVGMENNEVSTHLIVIIDILPEVVAAESNFYDVWLNAVITFCNTHILLNANNKLTVIASNFDKNTIIYPSDKMENEENFVSIPGQYELFSVVTKIIQAQLKSLISNARQYLESYPHRLNSIQSLIAGAIGIGLAKINKQKTSGQSSRIAVITAADDNSASFSCQYMNFMNAFFTAQKMNVVLDACVTSVSASGNQDTGMSLLQQGCDLTGGLYLRIPNHAALLEYLEWVLLPDVETRKKLVLPTQRKVSHKAACFCHRTLIDTGYVCSVCLSIFCSFSPICSTCHTVFKLGPLPSGIKPKRKSQKFK